MERPLDVSKAAAANSAVVAPTAFINGKFLTAPPTGVQRMARELVLALDDLLSRKSRDRTVSQWTLISPNGADALDLRAIAQIRTGAGGGVVWEQCILPFAAKSGVLVNLCNVAPLLHRRNIVTIHDAQIYQSRTSYDRAFRIWYRFLQPRLARRALALATVSNFSKREILDYGIAGARPIFVVPNGVDHILRHEPPQDALSRRGLTPMRYFLSMSSKQRHKNIAMLVSAFRKAKIPNFKLALVGDSAPDRQPESEDVVYLDAVGDGELRALYANAAFFLLPSITEGFGLPPGEALACGCPIAVSTGGALPEVYRGAAMMLDSGDERGWSEAMQAIAAQPALREEWLRRGEDLPRRLTWSAAAASYLQIVEDAIHSLPGT